MRHAPGQGRCPEAGTAKRGAAATLPIKMPKRKSREWWVLGELRNACWKFKQMSSQQSTPLRRDQTPETLSADSWRKTKVVLVKVAPE